MKKTLIILIMVLSSIGYGAWDNTKPSDSGTWNTAAGYIRANWDALEAILGTDLSTFDVNIITVDTAHVGAFDVNTIDANAADITTLTATNATISGVITAGAEIVMSTFGTIYNNTTDGNDTGGMTIQGGGNNNTQRGGSIYCFGNEHAIYPGRIVLVPGFSSGTVNASIDAFAHKIINVVDPGAMQDAATKNYVDTTAVIGNYGNVTTITTQIETTETDEVAATLAATNIFVVATCSATTDDRAVFKGKTCTTSGGTFIFRAAMSVYGYSNDLTGDSFSMFVKKGEYWKITRECHSSSTYGNATTRTYCTIAIGN